MTQRKKNNNGRCQLELVFLLHYVTKRPVCDGKKQVLKASQKTAFNAVTNFINQYYTK